MIDLEVATDSAKVKDYIGQFMDDLKLNAYVAQIDLTDEQQMGDPMLEQELNYCPGENCLVAIKAKTIETAAKNGKDVACSYCNGEFPVDGLVRVKLSFKKRGE
jgi:hypothetical protein